MSFNRKQGDRKKRRAVISEKPKYVSDASRRSQKQTLLTKLDSRDE